MSLFRFKSKPIFNFVDADLGWWAIGKCFMFLMKYSKLSWISDKEYDPLGNSNFSFLLGVWCVI